MFRQVNISRSFFLYEKRRELREWFDFFHLAVYHSGNNKNGLDSPYLAVLNDFLHDFTHEECNANHFARIRFFRVDCRQRYVWFAGDNVPFDLLGGVADDSARDIGLLLRLSAGNRGE